MEPSRAILLTGPAPGAIAVVRLTGPRVPAFLARHFSREPRPGRCTYGEVRDGDEVIDDAVAVTVPESDAVDLNVHGGVWVVRRVLDLAASAGFTTDSMPGGATAPLDAVDGDDPIEREVAAHLPRARTELALRVLLAQPQAWRELERLERDDPARYRAAAAAAVADPALEHLLEPPRVAIVGAPNVGKSTLANQLYARERSITADLPGTTRDWVGDVADVDGLAVVLVDTPGIRDTPDPLERAAIAAARREVQRADLVIVVLDPTRPLEPEQSPLLSAHPAARTVVNKSDRPAATGWSDPPRAVRTVATTGVGIPELRTLIARHFACADLDLTVARCWTQRQRAQLST